MIRPFLAIGVEQTKPRSLRPFGMINQMRDFLKGTPLSRLQCRVFENDVWQLRACLIPKHANQVRLLEGLQQARPADEPAPKRCELERGPAPGHPGALSAQTARPLVKADSLHWSSSSPVGSVDAWKLCAGMTTADLATAGTSTAVLPMMRPVPGW